MTISAVALFGSRARGDHDEKSDIDILLITNDLKPMHRSVSNLSLSLYPMEKLLRQAGDGNLFVLHLVSEAQPIYDPAGELARLRKAFRFQLSYDRDIQQASDLGWLLGRFGGTFTNNGLVNRRIAWCVRSILIARAAEQQRPVFSATALSTFSEDTNVSSLIRQKSALHGPSSGTLINLRRFLRCWGMPDPAPVARAVEDYRETFIRTNNDVAKATLKGIYKISDYT